jgi:hypothetical protein
MANPKSPQSAIAKNAAVLKTEVVSKDQSAALTQIVELSLEQLDDVGGGLTSVAMDPCHCCHPK